MLIERLTRDLTELGYRVGVLKHIHHGDFEVDIEGKDTWRYGRAGAHVIVGVSNSKMFLVERTSGYPDIRGIIESISHNVDVILMEGFKQIAGSWSDVYKVITLRAPEELPGLLEDLEEPILGVYGENIPEENVEKRLLCYEDIKKALINYIRARDKY